MTQQNLFRIVPALILSAALAACGKDGMGTATVSAGVSSPAAPLGAALVVSGVQVHEVWMVIRDIKLVPPGEEEEVNAGNGPFLLHLSGADLDGGITEEFVIEAPFGTYDELRFVVHKLEDTEMIGVPELDGPRASIAVRLSVGDGAPIVFTSQLNEQQRIPGRFVIEEGSVPDNITLTVDPSGWFSSPTGGFLDPSDPANQQAIELNIRNSIDAFEDDDHNGLSDDGPNHT